MGEGDDMSEEKHELKRCYGGKDEMSWIQSMCSCGWVGKKHYAWNDYQRTNLKNEWAEHLKS